MNAAQNFQKIHMKTCETFKAQNLDAGDFDVVFEINGRLYANKFLLCSASETFKTMLSDRWNSTKNDSTIKIESYSFNDFKNFITFIYSGDCALTNDNIFNMIDIAEFYGVTVFKETCEEFLFNHFKLDLNNIFQICDFIDKYSLIKLKPKNNDFFWKNFSSFLKSKQFQSLPKSTIKIFVEATHKTSRQEELFESVFKWAEKRATGNQNVHDAIKEELVDILTFIKFQLIEKEFFMEFVVKKAFVFSKDQIKDLANNRNKIRVKLTSKNGKIMKGELCCPDIDKVVKDIKSVKNICISTWNNSYGYWEDRHKKLSSRSKLSANEKIDWYLIYDEIYEMGSLAVKHRDELVKGNYFLAEMFAENGFELSKNCKIEIYRFV